MHRTTLRNIRAPRLAIFAFAGVGFIAATSARAVTINPTFDPSIAADFSATDAASYISAINYADGQFHSLFSDAITINITFMANPGTAILGQSSAGGQFIGNYTTLKSVLNADAKTADDATAIAHLPAVDPTGGQSYLSVTAQAKALGILAANNPGSDGTVTLGAGYTYTFDPAHRAVAGAFDFIGVAEHEITEVMGRYGDANLGGNYGPLDLFGYQFGAGGTGTGVLNLAANQDNNYFCIDGGVTPLKLYNNHSNGEDDKDWGAGSNDSFNAFSSPGVENDMTAVDIREMDVIGYDATPEPASFSLLALSAVGLLARRRRPS